MLIEPRPLRDLMQRLASDCISQITCLLKISGSLCIVAHPIMQLPAVDVSDVKIMIQRDRPVQIFQGLVMLAEMKMRSTPVVVRCGATWIQGDRSVEDLYRLIIDAGFSIDHAQTIICFNEPRIQGNCLGVIRNRLFDLAVFFKSSASRR